MKKKIGGFTLIELLIVVAIIAILAAIAVPNFLEAQVRSKVSRSKADMRTIATAIESYTVDTNKIPIDGSKSGDGVPYWYIPWALTTPIAYISTATLVDPFRSASFYSPAPDPDNAGVGLQEWRRYRYRNFPYTYGKTAVPVYAEIYGAWELMGNGPDRNAGPFLYITYHSVLLELTQPYDPTNGTASNGNMIRCPKSSDGRRLIPGD